MFTDFDYFKDSLDLEAIHKIMDMPLTEDEKRIAIGYVITKKLEGISICFPKKNHTTSYAKLLISKGIEISIVAESLEITEKTLKKYKAGNEQR